MKTPLHWTYVVYDEGDWIAQVLAVLSLFPYFVFFGHASVVLIRRDFSGLFLWYAGFETGGSYRIALEKIRNIFIWHSN